MDKKGFTLIELLVVVSTITVLSAIGVVSYNTIRGKTMDAKIKSDLNAIKKAYEANYDPTANGGQGGYKRLENSQFAGGKIPIQPNGSPYPCGVGPDLPPAPGEYGCAYQNAGGYQVSSTLSNNSATSIISNQGTIPSTQLNSCDPAGRLSSLSEGLVGYWKFNEGANTTANNSGSGGSALNGTLSGSTLPSWVTSEELGNALSFDGISSKLTVASAISNVRSISLWIKPTSIDYSGIIDLDGGIHTIAILNGTILTTGFSSPIIYVNGQLSSTVVANIWQNIQITTNTPFNTNSSMLIGNAKSSAISAAPNSITNLVHWLDASNGVYGDAGITPAVQNGAVYQWNDQSGNNYNFSSGNGTTLTTINNKAAVQFSDAGTNSGLYWPGGGPVGGPGTTAFFVQTFPTANQYAVMNGGSNTIWFLNTSGKVDFSTPYSGSNEIRGSTGAESNLVAYTLVGNGDSSAIYRNSLAETLTYAINTGGSRLGWWRFQAGMWLGSFVGNYYSYGNFTGAISEWLIYSRVLSTNEITAINNYLYGKYSLADYTTAPTYFKGVIDDVRIYNRVLTNLEITSLYNMKTSACVLP